MANCDFEQEHDEEVDAEWELEVEEGDETFTHHLCTPHKEAEIEDAENDPWVTDVTARRLTNQPSRG